MSFNLLGRKLPFHALSSLHIWRQHIKLPWPLNSKQLFNSKFTEYMYSYIQNHCQLRERCVVSRRVALATYCYGCFIHLGNAREKVIWNVLLLTNYCSKCMELVQIVERDLCFASAFRWYALPFGFRISLFLIFESVCVCFLSHCVFCCSLWNAAQLHPS